MTARLLGLRRREAAIPRTAPPLTAPPLDPGQVALLEQVTGRAELARVAAEQTHPRLRVWHTPGPYPWTWTITGPRGELIDGSIAETQPEALEVGLAALAVVSVARPASA